MRLAFLGLGLIGGSIARALRHGAAGGRTVGAARSMDEESRSNAEWTIAAWTPGGTGPRAALAAGVVDAAPARAEEALAGADLVVLAAPALACLELLGLLGGSLRGALAPGAVITDVASTKAALAARAADLGLRFVGGHPMAGREATGFGAADSGLLRGRPWVVVPAGDEAAVARVEALARACGAQPLRMGAADHDAAVAAISHLPLVVSAALVEAVAGTEDGPAPGWERAAPLAATGWQGMTRLARGDPEMGAGIAATNAQAIAAQLRGLRAALDLWLALLEDPAGPDAVEIRSRLAAAKARLDATAGDAGGQA